MRSQVYEWANLATGTNGSSIRRVADAVPQAIAADTSIDIFIGGTGNNITKPAETTATQFVVVEDVAVTPSAFCTALDDGTYRGYTQANGVAGPRAFIQVRINTTDYFLDPDNIGNDGIPGSASPYPRSIHFQPSFSLYPDVYVLPGQVWDALVTFYNSTISMNKKFTIT